MKRNIKKPLCITLCTLLLAGSIGIAAHAAVPNEKTSALPPHRTALPA